MNIADFPIPFSDLHHLLQSLHGILEKYSVFKSAVKIKFAIDGASIHFDTLTPSELAQLTTVAGIIGLNFALIAGRDTIIFRYYLS